MEITESKAAEFSRYEFYFKKNIHRTFLYLSKCSFNTLTADCEYYRSNREKLPLPVQMQLSKRPKIFCCSLWHFWNLIGIFWNFEHFQNKRASYL